MLRTCGVLVATIVAVLLPGAPDAVAADGCRPARVVVYTSTDWLRAARSLAANASPCAEYFISIPPPNADKTVIRAGGVAAQIRALGPAFHALAEVNVSAWQSWVTSTGNGWYAAGQEARRRMAAAGFSVAAGDTWALNEVSTAVRRGTGTARQDT